MTGFTDVEQVNPITNPRLQARLDIQSDIDVYARAILDLKSRLNALTPISTLPPELLAEILVCGAMDDHYSKRSHNPPYWIRLSHVCRHFRAVAHSTPRFWSFLPLTKSQTFSELLARSKSVPLHINASICRSSWVDRALALEFLLQHSRRLKELSIDGPCKFVQDFCSKIVSGFDVLERLELTTSSNYFDYIADYGTHLPPIVPIIAASDPPPRLRQLEIRRLPFRWNDLVFFPSLTTLVVSGSDAIDVGSFDELFSTLALLAPRLELLEIEGALPKQGLTLTNSIQLPSPSRTISLLSVKKVALTGNAPQIAHLLNHLSSPTTASIHMRVCNPVGSKELAQSIATHWSEKLPLQSLHITFDTSAQQLALSAWMTPSASDEPTLQLVFDCIPPDELLVPVLQGAGTLFTRIQELTLSGGMLPLKPKWAHFLPRFPSVTTLVVHSHPWDGFFPALATSRHLQDGRIYVVLPRLRVLELHGFRCSIPRDGLEPFDDLLDWAIFRCNCGFPVDEVRLHQCKYATPGKVKRLEEVVVDVHWDGWEMGSTTEEVGSV